MAVDEKRVKPGKKIVPVHLTEETWEKLRRIAFERRVSMNGLCREGIDYVIRKYEEDSE